MQRRSSGLEGLIDLMTTVSTIIWTDLNFYFFTWKQSACETRRHYLIYLKKFCLYNKPKYSNKLKSRSDALPLNHCSVMSMAHYEVQIRIINFHLKSFCNWKRCWHNEACMINQNVSWSFQSLIYFTTFSIRMVFLQIIDIKINSPVLGEHQLYLPINIHGLFILY